MGEIPQKLKVQVTGRAEVGAHGELGSHSERLPEKTPSLHFETDSLNLFMAVAVLGGFCGSVWAGFFCSSLSVFWQSCLRSQLHCLEVCHHCFVMSLICHPDLTAAALHHLQRQCWPVCSELGELQFGWAHCKLHVLRPLAMAPAKVLTVFSLLCKTCFEQFISWP